MKPVVRTPRVVTLPTWRECDDRMADGFVSALERFIYEQEPIGPRGDLWRLQLGETIAELICG